MTLTFYLWCFAFIIGTLVMQMMHVVNFLGIEWIQTVLERLLGRTLSKRNKDDDENPRGGFGGDAA